MRAVSLHPFLPVQLVARVVPYALLICIAFTCLLAFGTTGVGAAELSPIPNPPQPFRW
jgi:hypothetical protein